MLIRAHAQLFTIRKRSSWRRLFDEQKVDSRCIGEVHLTSASIIIVSSPPWMDNDVHVLSEPHLQTRSRMAKLDVL